MSVIAFPWQLPSSARPLGEPGQRLDVTAARRGPALPSALRMAYSLLAEAETALRDQQDQQVARSLEGCEALAEAHGLAAVQASSLAIRAALCDRRGKIDGYVAAIAALAHHAGRESPSAPVSAAFWRVGLDTPRLGPLGRALDQRLRRLGLLRPVERIVAQRGAFHLASASDLAQAPRRVMLDLDLRTLLIPGSPMLALSQGQVARLCELILMPGASSAPDPLLHELVGALTPLGRLVCARQPASNPRLFDELPVAVSMAWTPTRHRRIDATTALVCGPWLDTLARHG